MPYFTPGTPPLDLAPVGGRYYYATCDCCADVRSRNKIPAPPWTSYASGTLDLGWDDRSLRWLDSEGREWIPETGAEPLADWERALLDPITAFECTFESSVSTLAPADDITDEDRVYIARTTRTWERRTRVGRRNLPPRYDRPRNLAVAQALHDVARSLVEANPDSPRYLTLAYRTLADVANWEANPPSPTRPGRRNRKVRYFSDITRRFVDEFGLGDRSFVYTTTAESGSVLRPVEDRAMYCRSRCHHSGSYDERVDDQGSAYAASSYPNSQRVAVYRRTDAVVTEWAQTDRGYCFGCQRTIGTTSTDDNHHGYCYHCDNLGRVERDEHGNMTCRNCVGMAERFNRTCYACGFDHQDEADNARNCDGGEDDAATLLPTLRALNAVLNMPPVQGELWTEDEVANPDQPELPLVYTITHGPHTWTAASGDTITIEPGTLTFTVA